jgi:N-acetyl-alpha-D-muramate 1-phosphate uridylyltransferase
MKFPIVVIAGGLATRLYPMTLKIPKSLVAVNGEPFVLHQLRLFKRNGVRHVHYCLGHLGEMVEETIIKSNISEDIKVTFSFDGEKLLGTAGALLVLSKMHLIFCQIHFLLHMEIHILI